MKGKIEMIKMSRERAISEAFEDNSIWSEVLEEGCFTQEEVDELGDLLIPEPMYNIWLSILTEDPMLIFGSIGEIYHRLNKEVRFYHGLSRS